MADKETGETNGGDVSADDSNEQPLRSNVRWTAARKAKFLEHMARTCNMSFSARAVGMSPSSVQRVREHDPSFAEGYERAVQAGYLRVEADLLAHALSQGCTLEQGESGPMAVPAFDPDLAIKVLQQRGNSLRSKDRRTNGGTIKRATEREIEDALLSKLKGLAKRLALIA